MTNKNNIYILLVQFLRVFYLFDIILQYDYEYDEHGERVILGKGTFGVVYAGRDLSNQVRLAIKEIPEKDSR